MSFSEIFSRHKVIVYRLSRKPSTREELLSYLDRRDLSISGRQLDRDFHVIECTYGIDIIKSETIPIQFSIDKELLRQKSFFE